MNIPVICLHDISISPFSLSFSLSIVLFFQGNGIIQSCACDEVFMVKVSLHGQLLGGGDRKRRANINMSLITSPCFLPPHFFPPCLLRSSLSSLFSSHPLLLSQSNTMSLSCRQLCERACVCLCVCSRLSPYVPVWNVSLILLLLLEGQTSGLCSAISVFPYLPTVLNSSFTEDTSSTGIDPLCYECKENTLSASFIIAVKFGYL